MRISESLKKWEKFGLNQKTEKRKLHYSDLIVGKGNLKHGMIATYRDIQEGRLSKTKGPIQVCWIREENKFLVTDGYHRLLQYLLEGRTEYLCEIEWTGYSLEWKVPTRENRFILKENNKMRITQSQLRQIIKEELETVLNEADGKGCADTDKGCIRERDGGWVILNNKKGGVWRKCDSHSHCEEILDAFHASKG